MHALIAQVAVASVPKPMPVVLETVLCESAHGRRSQEEIPINARRSRTFRFLADARTPFIAQSFRCVELANGPIFQHLHGFLFVNNTAALRTHLDHALILSRRSNHLLTFPNVVAGWLFHVDIFPCLASPDATESVPMIGRGHGYCIHRFISEHFPHIAIGLRRFAAVVASNQRRAAFLRRLIHIHQGDYVGIIAKLAIFAHVRGASTA